MHPNRIKRAREDAPAQGSGYQVWSRRPFKGKAETHRSGSQKAFSRTRLLICRQSVRRANEGPCGTHNSRIDRG
jgi:hypothetical protein